MNTAQKVSSKYLQIVLLVLGGLGSLAMYSGILLQQSCKANSCSYDTRKPDSPIAAFECAADQLCYRGTCAKACNAGQESLEECASDSDCSGARPFCINDRCSSCTEGETCIAKLDVCRPVTDIPLPEVPDKPVAGTPLPPQPRDAGILSTGFKRLVDAGIMVVPVRPITHAALIDVAQVDVRTGVTQPGGSVSVRAVNLEGNGTELRSWRLDLNDVAWVSNVEPLDNTNCEIRTFTSTGVQVVPANFGEVLIDDPGSTGSLNVAEGITFGYNSMTGRYINQTGNLPSQLLNYSTLANNMNSTSMPRFIHVTSDGDGSTTTGSWPETQGNTNGHHVPFELIPAPITDTILQNRIVVDAGVGRDYTFRWNRINTGEVAGETVVLRITTQAGELFCEYFEGPGEAEQFSLLAGVLSNFRDNLGIQRGEVFPLVFERVTAKRLQVVPANNQQNLYVIVKVRHSIVSEIQF